MYYQKFPHFWQKYARISPLPIFCQWRILLRDYYRVDAPASAFFTLVQLLILILLLTLCGLTAQKTHQVGLLLTGNSKLIIFITIVTNLAIHRSFTTCFINLSHHTLVIAHPPGWLHGLCLRILVLTGCFVLMSFCHFSVLMSHRW